MEIIRKVGSLLERHLNENTRATVAQIQADIDYNIMMGNLEDPSEEETEE